MRIGLALLFCLATSASLHAQHSFVNRSFDIRFTEVQETDDAERPEIPQNRRTRIYVGRETAATRITRNWDKPPPGLEHLDASGGLGEWVSLQGRARIRHDVEGKVLTQTIATSSFTARIIIELDGADCKVRFENTLLPGQEYFRMRNIALGTPMRIFRLRTDAGASCAMSAEMLW